MEDLTFLPEILQGVCKDTVDQQVKREKITGRTPGYCGAQAEGLTIGTEGQPDTGGRSHFLFEQVHPGLPQRRLLRGKAIKMDAVAFLRHGYRAGGDGFDLFKGKVHADSPSIKIVI